MSSMEQRQRARGGPSEVRPFLSGLFARAFRSRPKISIGKWAERERLMIPPDESHGSPGAYRESTEPTATIVHKFLVDPRYKVFIGLKPSRIGFTLAAIVGMAYFIAHYAKNIIFCIDDHKQVKKLARTRLIPLLKSIKALSEIIPESGKKLTQIALYLKGMTLHLAGAKSISDVTSIGAGLVVGDEVDQWKDFASGEASAFHHLLDRIMDVPGGKAVFFGKPRNEGDILHSEWLTGTRHKCFVPCPHCGMMQTLEWKNVRFDHCKLANGNYDLVKVLREAYILCVSPTCQKNEEHGGRIYEHHKAEMLARHEWRQTYFGDDPDYQLDPEKMSVSINQLYSLRPELTIGAIAKHFITAQRAGGSAVAHFFRTRFGEAESKGQTVVKKEEVRRLQHYVSTQTLRAHWPAENADTFLRTLPRTPYRHGQCPWKPDYVYSFCDVQVNEKKWVIVATRGSGEAAVIDYGICLAFTQLLPIVDRPIEVVDWGDTPEDERVNPVVDFMWIDEGGADNNEVAVREFCAREDAYGRFFPSKGAGGIQIAQVVEPKKRKAAAPWHPNGEVEFECYHFSHDTFATELYQFRIRKHEEILLALAQGIEPEAQPLWLPAFPDEQFVEELCNEGLEKVRHRGQTVYRWLKRNKRINDFGDGVKGCLAEDYFMRPEHYRGLHAGATEDEESKPKQRTRDYELKRLK